MRQALLACFLLLPGACMAPRGTPDPVIEQRLHSWTDAPAPAGAVAIDVFTSDPPPAAGTSPQGPVERRDSIARHVVIAVRPAGFLAPGDRVDATRIALELTSPGWRFARWTAATNGQTVIELGKLTDTAATKAGASANLAPGGGLPGVSLDAERSRSLARELQLRDTTDFDAAIDNDGRAWLNELAGWRTSLAHNLAIDAVATAPAADLLPRAAVTATPLHDDQGRPVPAAAARLAEQMVLAPLHYDNDPVCGIARLTFRIRHVPDQKQARTFSEADDDVIFQTGTAETRFLFAPPPFAPLVGLRSGGRMLHYRIAGAGAPAVLLFHSIEDAMAFRGWLRQQAPAGGRLGNAAIGFAGPAGLRPPSVQEIADLSPVDEKGAPARPAPQGACR
jgi:hypothetical protein